MLFPDNKGNIEEEFTINGDALSVPDVPSPICPPL
jgi:hypothetical protein